MEPGAVIAERFEIEREAGRGGMGAVFRASDRVGGGFVALKVLTEPADEASKARFLREAQALAGLIHPGIVRYVAHGTTERSEPYLAMEWVEGEDLQARLQRQGALEVDEAVRLCVRVADALHFAHVRGLVHRDIKPGNLLLPNGEIDRVKVVDFGLAQQAGNTGVTRSGTTLGTPGYMAPEQARGEQSVDARADIYSLGCVAFECLTGRAPFMGDHVMAVLAKVLLEDAPLISTIRPAVPVGVERIVARMLAKDRAARPKSAQEVVDSLTVAAPATTPSLFPQTRGNTAGAITDGEQRFVSVVLCWPKREPSAQAMQEIERTVATHGARLDRLLDASMVVTLGSGRAATDQAAEVARCALAMYALLRDQDASLAVALGRGAASHDSQLGDAVDRAASVLRGATTKGIFVDPALAELLDARFEVARDATTSRLIGARGTVEVTRTLLGRKNTCVGRDRELATILRTVEESIDDGCARAVLVTGEAGIGKSRLRYEVVERLKGRDDPPQVWMARGESLGAGSPFQFLGSALRIEAGIRDGDARELQRERLSSLVSRLLPENDRDAVACFLGEMLGVPFDDAGRVQLQAARREPALLRDRIRDALERLLAAACAKRPLVLVLEDLQWGDLPSVQLLDAMLAALVEAPFAVIALARPEVHDRFPRLWRTRALHAMALDALPRKASERIVREALGTSVDDETLARLIDRAGGNAFYLEELIRAVASGKGDALPESVLATVQARLQTIASSARRALRAASVFGQIFWPGGVSRLLGEGEPVDDWLKVLVQEEVVVPKGEGRFPGEDQYFFRHSLLREASYAMLTDDDRKRGHALAAEWLTKVGEHDPTVLGEHFERGGMLAEAIGFHRTAAEQALHADDFHGAIDRALRGVACGASGRTLGSLRRIEGEARRWMGEQAISAQCLEDALMLLDPGSEEWLVSATELMNVHASVGDIGSLLLRAEIVRRTEPTAATSDAWISAATVAVKKLMELGFPDDAGEMTVAFERAVATFPTSGPLTEAHVHHLRALRGVQEGDLGVAREAYRKIVDCWRRAGHSRALCRDLANLGSYTMQFGLWDEAEKVLREALAIAKRLDAGSVVMLAMGNLAYVVGAQGRNQEARTFIDEAIKMSDEANIARFGAMFRIYRAMFRLSEGDFDGAAEEARLAIAEPFPPVQAQGFGMLSEALAKKGDRAGALDAATQAARLLDSLGAIDEGELRIRLAYAEALRDSGDLEGAKTAIATAEGRLREIGGRIHDESMRDAFATGVAENVRIAELYAALVRA